MQITRGEHLVSTAVEERKDPDAALTSLSGLKEQQDLARTSTSLIGTKSKSSLIKALLRSVMT